MKKRKRKKDCRFLADVWPLFQLPKKAAEVLV
jgi:hypothetical protein